ncbi:hypothetical protein QLL95_gp1000 [Cotonvirus japonicus]|uniref:Uncharacterized protein n=1 Tax=Cotonvirus japonicus TaxID=2811091 RepID=A0ABM7NSJ3_9VIRU|nr:hypothetical protein QLL95_gp1000 [Cotonvirus japonicus]BCS83123.1 hypothetical protein [Cotonvirus japonicus]
MQQTQELHTLQNQLKTINLQLHYKNHAQTFIDKQLILAKLNNTEKITKFSNDLEKIKIKINRLCKEKTSIQNRIINLRNAIESDNVITSLEVVLVLNPKTNKDYLDQCIRYLRAQILPEFDNAPMTSQQLIEMRELGIITRAHQIYNDYLVKATGPHEFYHTHDDYKLCQWNGYSSVCECGKNCVTWSIAGFDLLDFGLNHIKPIGQAVCQW